MGRVRHCSDRQSGVAGCGLDLGGSATAATQDHRMGVVSSDPGRAVDLGILLAGSRTPGGIGRNYWLDSPCGK